MRFARLQLSSTTAIIAIAAATATIRFLRFRFPYSPPLKSISTKSMMGSSIPSLLVLCNKSPEEDELAEALKSKWKTLKILNGDENDEIRVLLRCELDLINQMTFQTQDYMNALSTSKFGRFLAWLPSLPSTHDLVAKSSEECMGITSWLPFVLFYGADGGWAQITSLAGLPKLDVRIKWPNDLYLNALKVGGILCTSTYRSKKFDVCAGIGLNVDNEKPTTCLNAILQEVSSVPHKLTREDILAAFFNKFEELFETFSNKGFQVLEELYYKAWLHSGQKVVIEEKHEGQPVADISVTIKGLTSSGYLLATDEDNKSYELHPDGNSFDFFKGLAKRKLN